MAAALLKWDLVNDSCFKASWVNDGGDDDDDDEEEEEDDDGEDDEDNDEDDDEVMVTMMMTMTMVMTMTMKDGDCDDDHMFCLWMRPSGELGGDRACLHGKRRGRGPRGGGRGGFGPGGRPRGSGPLLRPLWRNTSGRRRSQSPLHQGPEGAPQPPVQGGSKRLPPLICPLGIMF